MRTITNTFTIDTLRPEGFTELRISGYEMTADEQRDYFELTLLYTVSGTLVAGELYTGSCGYVAKALHNRCKEGFLDRWFSNPDQVRRVHRDELLQMLS